MRQRGKDTWRLRVYVGIDPVTRKQRWLAKTVQGTRRFATKQLREYLKEAGQARTHRGLRDEDQQELGRPQKAKFRFRAKTARLMIDPATYAHGVSATASSLNGVAQHARWPGGDLGSARRSWRHRPA